MIVRNPLFKLLIVPLSIFISSCSNQSRNVPKNLLEVEALNEEQISHLRSMGDSGQGWAYEILAGDARAARDSQASDLWNAKALRAGESLTCIRYARRLLSMADNIEDPNAKTIILEESRKYARLAIRNSFLYPENFGKEKGILHIKMASDVLSEIKKRKSN